MTKLADNPLFSHSGSDLPLKSQKTKIAIILQEP